MLIYVLIVTVLGGQPSDVGMIKRVDGDQIIEFNVSIVAALT